MEIGTDWFSQFKFKKSGYFNNNMQYGLKFYLIALWYRSYPYWWYCSYRIRGYDKREEARNKKLMSRYFKKYWEQIDKMLGK